MTAPLRALKARAGASVERVTPPTRVTRIAFVCRELHPLGGGGIGVQMAGAARRSPRSPRSPCSRARHTRRRYRELERAGDPRLPRGVRFAFVEEPAPGELGSYYGFMHLYSARVLRQAARSSTASDGPDLIEFADFLGEALVTVQARRALRAASCATRRSACAYTPPRRCAASSTATSTTSFETRDGLRRRAPRPALRRSGALARRGGARHLRRFYGADALAPAAAIRPIVPQRAPADPPRAARRSEHVRLLYMGRLERRKGVQDLIRAVTGLRRDDWTLTLLGGDTDTAPLGLSMRDQLGARRRRRPAHRVPRRAPARRGRQAGRRPRRRRCARRAGSAGRA